MSVITRVNGEELQLAPPFSSLASAEAFSIMYLAKNYLAEAAWLRKLIRRYGGRDLQSLLDVACGPASHIEHLWPHFERVVGVDKSEAMLAVARRILPSNVELYVGTMENPGENLPDPQFDIVTCLFGSLAYQKTIEGLNSAIRAMAAIGQWVIIEPGPTPENHNTHDLIRSLRVKSPTGETVIRLSAGQYVEGNYYSSRQHITFGRVNPRTQQIEVDFFAENHEIGVFSHGRYQAAMEAAGLQDVQFVPAPPDLGPLCSGVFIGRR